TCRVRHARTFGRVAGPGLLLGFCPPLLEVFFPVLRPRAAEIIDEARLARNQLGRLAVGTVDDRALHPALDEVEPPLRIVERRALLPRGHRVQRPCERLRIVEGRADGRTLTVDTTFYDPEAFTRPLHTVR